MGEPVGGAACVEVAGSNWDFRCEAAEGTMRVVHAMSGKCLSHPGAGRTVSAENETCTPWTIEKVSLACYDRVNGRSAGKEALTGSTSTDKQCFCSR